ncbi:MAG: hypothetical protein WC218_09405 [Candidatus Cloacimonadales bacterium]
MKQIRKKEENSQWDHEQKEGSIQMEIMKKGGNQPMEQCAQHFTEKNISNQNKLIDRVKSKIDRTIRLSCFFSKWYNSQLFLKK